jgi:hypothetical protein
MTDIVCPFCKVEVNSHEALPCLDAWLALAVLKQAVNTITVVDQIRGLIAGEEALRTEYEAYPADIAARETVAIPAYSRDAEAIQAILAASLVGTHSFAERLALSLSQADNTDPNDLIWEARFRPITEEKLPEWWSAKAPTFPLAVARAALIASENAA